ncbi:hypothetical protein GWI33_009532 [Rhynchophorus ferrugineus]|uniref:Uncharacterized protein n=1 Tax=Rhynchophorus ferrugineus TaxID=354439 RepID=A0A834MMG8_RHYFE|nr:hypothetical protein GWI33_009532 [Rhynchophorus ferrugineus]
MVAGVLRTPRHQRDTQEEKETLYVPVKRYASRERDVYARSSDRAARTRFTADGVNSLRECCSGVEGAAFG